jgi:hypothetical protein
VPARARSDGDRGVSATFVAFHSNRGSSALLGDTSGATLSEMTLKARVTAGRLVVDEPTNLPDGTELDLLPLDPGDWLDETDRAALHKALRESNVDIATGHLVDADDILRELRSR